MSEFRRQSSDKDGGHDYVYCGACKRTFDVSDMLDFNDNSVCMTCVQGVIDAIVEKVRWRRFPAEEPPGRGPCDYLVRRGDDGERLVCQWRDGTWLLDIAGIITKQQADITHWTEIPPLPANLPSYET